MSSQGDSGGTGLPKTCSDGAKNALETDVDCGGSQCLPCPPGKVCAIGTDCSSAVCLNLVCKEPTACSDGKMDDLETDVDCGGAGCAPCPTGKHCVLDGDCEVKSCQGGVCKTIATCGDGKKSGDESDVDCGGSVCAKCSDGAKCGTDLDCLSASCANGTCAPVSQCTDGKKNGTETDIDCGGGVCPICSSGQHCLKGTDCSSELCVNAVCTAPTCSDQVKNGQETDLDCGGGGVDCVPCEAGQACKDAQDCLSQLCQNGVCKVQPACSDGAKNGSETDKDCGGPLCPGCVPGKTCLSQKDCAAGVCKNSLCQAATCTDGFKNGNETDADCGGGICPKCTSGKGCLGSPDCASPPSDMCADPACIAGTCGKQGKSCADSDPCTIDGCAPTTGKCTNIANTCDDGSLCTSDSCEGATGKCLHVEKSVSDCDDGNLCTNDSCKAATGCNNVELSNGSSCDLDASKCTVDTCSAGQCKAGAAASCDDKKACTVDVCDSVTGCSNKLVSDGGSCDLDASKCTQDLCLAGSCTKGTPLVCDDKNACTTDLCDPAAGCVSKPVPDGAVCEEDGNMCTADSCTGGFCKVGLPTQCNDANECTMDTCAPTKGCVHSVVSKACDADGSVCTAGDSCKAGKCVAGAPLVCNDAKPCTSDLCDKTVGCVFLPAVAGCDDGNPCTMNDSCSNGACVGVKFKCDPCMNLGGTAIDVTPGHVALCKNVVTGSALKTIKLPDNWFVCTVAAMVTWAPPKSGTESGLVAAMYLVNTPCWYGYDSFMKYYPMTSPLNLVGSYVCNGGDPTKFTTHLLACHN